jgi:hypothetical protein
MRPEFLAIVRGARAVIEGFCETQLHEGRNAATIWNLMQCNFGYRMPKTEVVQELTGKDGAPLNPVGNDEKATSTREAMLASLHGSLTNRIPDTTGEGQ